MTVTIEKIKREIEDLERQIEANPFSGLFDRSRQDQLFRKLKKKRKQLAELEKPKSKPKTKESAKTKTPAKKKAAGPKKAK